MYSSMNAVKHIRERVFKLTQAPFAALAGVSQPTVSRWEEADCQGSEPTREQMARIRAAAIKRGIEWDDRWFFEVPADSEQARAT